jgi:hypothetical protein
MIGSDIYTKSFWGKGACDNTVGWGIIYRPFAGCSAVDGLLVTLQARATYYENATCTSATLTELENIV